MAQFDTRYAEQAREKELELNQIGAREGLKPIKATLVERAQEVHNHLLVARATLEEVSVTLALLRDGPVPTPGGVDAVNQSVGQPDNLAGNLSNIKDTALMLVDISRNLSDRMRQLRQEVGQLY